MDGTVDIARRQTSANRTALILRWLLAGPLTLIAAVATMASSPLWMPGGAAGIDNLIFPIILFPAFWALYFFYALIEPRPWRGLAVMLILIAVNAAVIYAQF